jgi:hypothetical protein
MPTPASPGTNKFLCEACGRHFNTEGELKEHGAQCMAAKQTGSGDTRAAGANQREEGEDRDWVSTP